MSERKPRKSRAWAQDFKQLVAADRAILRTTPRMRRSTLEYLWDKYVTHAEKAPDAQ